MTKSHQKLVIFPPLAPQLSLHYLETVQATKNRICKSRQIKFSRIIVFHGILRFRMQRKQAATKATKLVLSEIY